MGLGCASRRWTRDDGRRAGLAAVLGVLVVLLFGAAAMPSGDGLDERVRAAARAALAAQFPEAVHRLDVRVRRVSGDLRPLDRFRVVLPAADGLPRGTTQATLEAHDGDGWQAAGRALLYIAHFDSVMMTRATLASGAPVPPEAVNATWVETTNFRGDPLTPPAFRRLAAEAVAARRLPEGRLLRLSDLRPPYAAETGEAVLLRYRRGGLAFELPCTARAPGFRGDAIRLFCASTGKTYRARLAEPGTADWIETL